MDDRRDVPAAEGTRGIATVTVLLLVMVNAVSGAAIPQWFPKCLSTRELIVATQHTHTHTHTNAHLPCTVTTVQCKSLYNLSCVPENPDHPCLLC